MKPSDSIIGLTNLLLVIIGVFFHSESLQAQDSETITTVYQITTDDGLLHNQVFCSLQDSHGFMWFGTEYGLSRFDGHDFIHFTKEKNGLGGNSISQLIEDENGKLWVISYHENYYGYKVKSLSIIDLNKLEVISEAEMKGINFPVATDAIFLIASSTTARINVFSDSHTYYPYSPKEGFQNPIKLTAPNKLGEVLNFIDKPLSAAIDAAIKIYEDGFHNIVHYSLNEQGSHTSLKILAKENDGDFLYALSPSENIIYRRKTNGNIELVKGFNKVEVLKEAEIWATAYCRPRDNSIWLENTISVLVFSPDHDGRYHLKETFTPAPKEQIGSLYLGPEGTVWINGSRGATAIVTKNNPFQKFPPSSALSDESIYFTSCRSMFLRNDSLLVSSYSGNFIVDLKNETTQQVGRSFLFAPILEFGERGLITGHFEGLYIGDTWGTDLTLVTDPVAGFDIWSLLSNHPDTIWVGSNQGLFFWKVGSSELTAYLPPPLFSELNAATVYHIEELENGHLLLATSVGVFELNQSREIIQRFWSKGKEAAYLPHDRYYHFSKINNNEYWLASEGGGFIHWNKKNGKSRQYLTEDGLPSNIVYAIYPGVDGNLWMSTYAGLAVFQPGTGDISIFDEKDGLTHREFNRLSHLAAPDGRLFFGGLNGVNAFYPNDLGIGKKIEKPFFITEIKQFDKSINENIDQTIFFKNEGKIIIGPNVGVTKIRFSLLDFRNLGNIEYSAKIEGRKNKWRKLEENMVEVNGLPPGEYNLQIKARPINGEYAGLVKNLVIEVEKAYYQKWWFYILCIGSAVLIIWLYGRWRTAQLRKQKMKLDKLVQERAEEINRQAAQMKEKEAMIEQQAKKLSEMERGNEVSKEDQEWLEQFEKIAEENLGNPNFKAQELASALNLSRTQCFRKLKALTGMTPGAWLQEARLQKAKQLLEKKSQGSVKAVAYEVGVNPNYFSEAFKKRFGKLPSDYF